MKVFSKKMQTLLGLLLFSFFATFGFASDFKNNFNWSEMNSLPSGKNQTNQIGLAAAFSGSYDGMAIIAGGANFPKIVAAKGGEKYYYDDVFVLLSGEDKWKLAGTLPYKVAHGTSVSLPDGVLIIGGKNGERHLSEVRLLKYNITEQRIETEVFPNLPFPISEMGAALIDDVVYVVGGLKDGQLANNFLRLDLSKRGTSAFGWEVLPDYPGAPRLQPVVVAQNSAEQMRLYVFSGSSHNANKEAPDVLTDGLEYFPFRATWRVLDKIQVEGKEYSVHGGVGVAVGSNSIVVAGGVNKEVFKNALEQIRKGQNAKNRGDTLAYNTYQKWLYEYLTQEPDWYQFNKDLLVYNTITDKWAIGDTRKGLARAGLSLIPWQEGWLLVNGETKPGVRTAEVSFFEMEADPQFGWINWLVLVLYLFGMLYLGYYFMKKEQSTDDFFTGGGRIPWWAAGISIFATMLSAITFMAIPAKVFATDWKYFPMAITILIMAFPVVKYYLPFFRRLSVTTAYEYLERRFNYSTRFLASFLFIIFMTARMALVLFLPSLALSTVTGIDIYIAIVLMGVITIIYCTMGGVEAVVWGDVIQGIVLMGGAVVAVIFLVAGTEGGWNTVMTISVEHDKFRMFDWSFDWTKATLWVVLLGGLANNLISYSSDQTVIQRYMTTKDEESSKRSIILNGVLSIVVSILFYFIGTALYAYYSTTPEKMNFSMSNPDSIFPHFIMAELPVGLAGLLIAAIFAATMSTVSSNINSISTSFTADFFKHFYPKATDKKQLGVARWTGVLFGGIGVGIALLMATWNILSLFDYFNYILGLLSSGLGGLFMMGIFFPRIDGRSALIGFVLGTLSLLWISLYTPISFLLFGFIGMMMSVFIALVFSYIIPQKRVEMKGLTWKTLNDK